MRNHGWQLPYHLLQVVAVAVFLALGVAFYVFFVPFVGKKILQYVLMGTYTILVTCVFGLYIWCVAADPADPRVFKSKKFLNLPEKEKHIRPKNSKLDGKSTSSIYNANASTFGGKSMDKDAVNTDVASTSHATEIEKKNASSACFMGLLAALAPCAFICNFCSSSEESSEQQNSEDGMFYCSLCEVEVFKYSKHCRVCDKCVDRFDHHCRWLNNCVGKRNYQKFFTLMISSLFLLILQWSTGCLVLTCCFLERKQFSVDVASKLGSSFTLLPFIIVVAVCTILAMIATLPLAQLLFFHILLIKKGISTYDYIMALREQDQEQQGVIGQPSPQISPASSLTALSSASSFTIHRASWCTPPRLFLENQFDVVPPETGSVKNDRTKKNNTKPVKISSWALARLNSEDISKAATEARKKSRIMQPVARTESPFMSDADRHFVSTSHHGTIPKPNSSSSSSSRRRANMRAARHSTTRTAVQTSSPGILPSSPESSLGSPNILLFCVSSSGLEDTMQEVPLSRSTSDGYEASGGEDSDWMPSRIVQRSMNWSNPVFSADQDEGIHRLNKI